MTIVSPPAGMPDTVKPSPPDLDVRQLTAADLPAMLALQDATLQSLPEADKAFVIPKTVQQLAVFMDEPHYGVGVFHKGELIAQNLLYVVTGSGQSPKGLIDCPTVRHICAGYERYGVSQTVLVHPAWRKQGLMGRMIAYTTPVARQKNLEAIFSEVAANNAASTAGFIRKGYEIVGNAVDPTDGTQLVFLRQAVLPPRPANTNILPAVKRPPHP